MKKEDIPHLFGEDSPYGPEVNIVTKSLYLKLSEEFNLTPFDALFNIQKYVEVYSKSGSNISMTWNDDDMSIGIDMSKDDDKLYIKIDWYTTSGHHVVIEQVLHDDGTIEVSAKIGTDPSEYFYSTVVEIFNELNINVSYIC